jgi:protoporphyrinogen oxidase
VGIVGAGFAGLRCADKLLQYGFQVTILEARNRLGGRVHQHTLPNGHLVDSGPNWIHGTDDNPILDIAKQTKTAVGSWDTTSYVFDEDGKLLDLDEGEALSTIMWNIMEAAFKHSNKNSAAIDADQSLLDYFKQHVAEHIPDTVQGSERQRRTVLQMADLWGSFDGSPIEKQSFKFYWLVERLDGGRQCSQGQASKP